MTKPLTNAWRIQQLMGAHAHLVKARDAIIEARHAEIDRGLASLIDPLTDLLSRVDRAAALIPDMLADLPREGARQPGPGGFGFINDGGYHRSGICTDDVSMADMGHWIPPTPIDGTEPEGSAMARTKVRNLRYPRALQAFPEFQDGSWGNDEADSLMFRANGTPYVVWVDHENPADRSIGEDHPRFCVFPLVDGVDVWGERDTEGKLPVFETEDADALVAFFAKPEVKP